MTDEELKQLIESNAKAIAAAAEERREMRESIAELRQSTSELRQSTSELRQSTGDLRATIADLRDISVGHERRISRVEGKEIDAWGDRLTLAEKLQVLEARVKRLEARDDNGTP
ncbi:MAG: hypothetical protein AAFY67_21335 [Cyanobacteria bacterium J06642_9]